MKNSAPPGKADRKRGSGVKRVYDVLRDEIIDLELEPGSPIDEIQLAERFEMSRTPIREALVRLAGDGLVTTLPNRSTVVSKYRVTTRLAAQYHTAQDLQVIRAQQANFARAVKDQDALAMISTNREFHAAIAVAAQNTYYEGLFIRLLDEGRRILRLYYQSYHDQLPQQYVTEHDDIIAAIAARDVEKADILAQEHANQIVTQIQHLIASDRRKKIVL